MTCTSSPAAPGAAELNVSTNNPQTSRRFGMDMDSSRSVVQPRRPRCARECMGELGIENQSCDGGTKTVMAWEWETSAPYGTGEGPPDWFSGISIAGWDYG